MVKYVDNVVLAGSPINQSLKSALDEHKMTGNVIVYNLKGDPLQAPLTDKQILKAIPTLIEQQETLTGHHSLTGPDNEANRQEFLNYLREQGLE